MNPWKSRQPAHKQIQAMRETAHSFRKSTAQRRPRWLKKIRIPWLFFPGVLGAQHFLSLAAGGVLGRTLSDREVGIAGHDQTGGDEGDDAEPDGDLAGDQRALPGRRLVTHGS